MKTTRLMAAMIAALACGTVTALAQSTPPGDQIKDQDKLQDQVRDQDRLQDCSPALDQDRTRLHLSQPIEIQQAVQYMKKAREQYQQQKREKAKELAGVTDQERDRLRDQLLDSIREQARDREQLRDRLQELRECLPSHQELMEQPREQTPDREPHGDN